VYKQVLLTGLLVAMAMPVAAADTPEARKARMIAGDVLKETRAVLEGALASGPAASALRVCASAAQNLARKHEQEGWRVRRVSEKVRNPADTPHPDELEVLQGWARAHLEGRLRPSDEHEEVISQGDRRYYLYMRPILIAGPVCLQCHGATDKLAPGVREALGELYPGDRATGYQIGDLRGAISVKIPLPTAE
jgi:hypothetical protein